MLRRLLLRGVRIMALNRGEAPVGEAGGETVMPYIEREAGLEGERVFVEVGEEVIKSWTMQGSFGGRLAFELARSQ